MINFLCFLFLGTFGWGISIFLMKILVDFLSPIEIVLYRMVIGTIVLYFLAKMMKAKVTHLKHLFIDGAIVGTFNMTIPFYLTTYAVKNVSSSLASIINGLTPLFTLLLGILFFSSNQKIGFINLVSIFLGLLGIVIINADVSVHGSFIDLIALIATAISYGLTANYFKYYAKTQDPLWVAAMAAFFSAVTMLILKISMESSSVWHFPQTKEQILALLWLGMIGSGVGLYLYFFLIKNTGAFFASMITYLMTVTGVLMGFFFLHERLSMAEWIGCVLIIMSLMLINHAEKLKNTFLLLNKRLST